VCEVFYKDFLFHHDREKIVFKMLILKAIYIPGEHNRLLEVSDFCYDYEMRNNISSSFAVVEKLKCFGSEFPLEYTFVFISINLKKT